jgi:hypothetical protein
MANPPLTSLYLALALLASALPGCGPLQDQGELQGVRLYDLPDLYKSPDAMSPVAIGSRDVVSLPAPGAMSGPVMLRLRSEPGAIVRYGFDELSADQPYPYEYKDPILVVPPITIWAQGEKDGLRGVARSFSFTEDAAALPPISVLKARRLVASDDVATTVLADDAVAEAPGGTERRVLDARGDVPSPYAAVDLVEVTAGEADDNFYFVLRLAASPRTNDRIAYGVEFGPSFVTSTNFGGGADLLYRADVTSGALKLWQNDRDTDAKKELPKSGVTAVTVTDKVEIRVAKADVPFLAEQNELAVRAYAYEGVDAVFAQDRAEPVFLRSQFATRTHRFGPEARLTELQFMAAPSVMNDKFSEEYLALGELFVSGLERANRIRLVGRGSLPLFYTVKEERGYAGLNTSDRGMLTTIGPNAAVLAKGQILAHELAHFQNARSAKIEGRWLQEAMSEWSAERLLYRHFPARSVHRFMRALRYDSYFNVVEDEGGDDFPLDTWGQDAAPLGYQKSLMFMALLESHVGQEPLIEAFQRAQSEPMSTDSFLAFLERRAGKDVDGLVPFWVKGGSPSSAGDPERLFVDDDADGLLNLDEKVLGSNPAHPDTDGDGYPDGEEQFGGRSPTQSDLVPDGKPQLVGAGAGATSVMMRLGAAPGESIKYALDPFDPDLFDTYGGPRPLRSPFDVVARIDGDAQAYTLSRGLFVDGQEVAVTYRTDNILPPTPRTTRDLRSDVTIVPNAGVDGTLSDAAGDMPDELSAYDLTGVRVTETDTYLEVLMPTRGAPDRLGSYGDYVVNFDAPVFSATGATLNKVATFKLSGGAPYWQRLTGSDRSMKLMTSGVTVTYGKRDVRVRLVASLLEEWRDATGEAWVCPRTDVSLDDGQTVVDTAGCVVTRTSGHIHRTGKAPDHWGVGEHTLQVFIQSAEFSEARAEGLIDLGLTAIKEFERVLGRPWLDRSSWPIHVHYAGSSTVGSASQRTGALLSAPESFEGDTFDYLFVEQLARLAVVDVLGVVDVPYWVQELFVQWLTSSALYRVLPSHSVHDFHAGRLNDYRCYLANNVLCQDFYSAELPLAEWQESTVDSTGSVKSLLAALYLDALVGPEAMGQALGMFVNNAPTSTLLKLRLQGLAPGHSAAIDTFFDQWVFGTGNAASDKAAVQATLVDADNDDLYKFEEDELGTDDSVDDPYLD